MEVGRKIKEYEEKEELKQKEDDVMDNCEDCE